jgi:hypothetical protein
MSAIAKPSEQEPPIQEHFPLTQGKARMSVLRFTMDKYNYYGFSWYYRRWCLELRISLRILVQLASSLSNMVENPFQV